MTRLLAAAFALSLTGNVLASSMPVLYATDAIQTATIDRSGGASMEAMDASGMGVISDFAIRASPGAWVVDAARTLAETGSHLSMSTKFLCGERAGCVRHSVESVDPAYARPFAPIVTARVPLPAAGWLFGSAVIGFVILANRRKV